MNQLSEAKVMKNIPILLFTAMIIITCLMSGCTQQNPNSNTNNNTTDSDTDGTQDHQDQPGKLVIISGNETLKQNEGIGRSFEVNDDYKYIVVNWEVINPQNLTPDEQHDIVFELTYPPSNISEDYAYDLVNNRNLNFTISSSNSGNWSYGFLNMGQISNITIYREIYLLK